MRRAALSLVLAAVASLGGCATTDDLSDRRQAAISEMVELSERYTYSPCGEGTACLRDVETYGEKIDRLGSKIEKRDHAWEPWIEGVHGLIDPRETPDGTFVQFARDPGREELHQLLIDQALAEAEPNQARPEALLTMGGPGTGKSTVLKLLGLCQDEVVVINSDEFKEEFVEYRIGVAAKDLLASDRVHEESSVLAKRARREAIDSHRSFCFDGTLKKLQPALDLIAELQAAGYEVTVIGVTVPLEVALERVRLRAEETGRFVPRDFIEDAHQRITTNAATVLGAADLGYLYDADVPFGDPPILLSAYRDGVELDAETGPEERP